MSKNQEINNCLASADYLKISVFPSLRTALERKWSIIQHESPENANHRRLVKGLDLLAQELWNLNGLKDETNLFLMTRVKEILHEKPRPLFPKHMLLSEQEAVIRIQSFVRAFLVRIRPDVAEMRTFWREIRNKRSVILKCKNKRNND